MKKYFFTILYLIFACFIYSATLPPDPPSFNYISVHDPSVTNSKVNNLFYIFGSHLAAGRTPNLMQWTLIASGVSNSNPLIPNVFTELAEVFAWAETDTLWAPHVIPMNNKYYMYYCACRGDSPRSALGLAVANSVEGPYSNQGIMLRSGMWGQPSEDGTIYDATIHPNVVDPHTLFDKTGSNLWMVYGSYSGGIFILQLNPATGFQYSGQGYGTKLLGGNHSRIEGPFILYSGETNYYYLFLSFGGLAADGGYNIRVARSTNINGPYYDSEGKNMINCKGANGTIFDDVSIAPYGVKIIGNFRFDSNYGYVSPGHNSAYYYSEKNEYYLIFHTRFPGQGEFHQVRTHQMFLNQDGWFVVAPLPYVGEKLYSINSQEIAGDYLYINHGKEISATVKDAVGITLNTGGTITGGITGTWQNSGNYYGIITTGGDQYRGLFIKHQWDPSFNCYTSTFTGLSNKGMAVWLKRRIVQTTTYTLNINMNGSGTVTRVRNKTNYYSGESVLLYAQPSNGYRFVSWSGDITSTENPVVVIMNSNKNITANFEIIGSATPVASFTRTSTFTRTPTPTRTRTATFTMTRTVTPTATYTMTPTRTSTGTATRTNTVIITSTWTGTRTVTVTYTRTATTTFTNTSTRTNTPVATSTYTSSRTATATYTRTTIPTFSRTATGTNTIIPSSTFTSTRTVTSTRTSTPTLTFTDTISSNTPTATPTFTRTLTRTSTPTQTQTPTRTRTNTTTPLSTNTQTPTPTYTRTATQTQTYTGTRTQTPTLTYTDTISSNTPTVMSTYTRTWTITLTWTNTATPSSTNTRTSTLTLTATNSVTATPTQTRTSTASNTATMTTTPSFTATRTRPPTFTSTSTLTLPPTMTVTPTITNIPVNNQEMAINNIVIYPNPYNPDKGDLNIKFDLTQPSKLIRVRIYTSSFRMIKKITQTGNFTGGRNIIELENKYLLTMANGAYYLILEINDWKDNYIKTKPEILIILK